MITAPPVPPTSRQMMPEATAAGTFALLTPMMNVPREEWARRNWAPNASGTQAKSPREQALAGCGRVDRPFDTVVVKNLVYGKRLSRPGLVAVRGSRLSHNRLAPR